MKFGIQENEFIIVCAIFNFYNLIIRVIQPFLNICFVLFFTHSVSVEEEQRTRDRREGQAAEEKEH